jgi:hypothetical protein
MALVQNIEPRTSGILHRNSDLEEYLDSLQSQVDDQVRPEVGAGTGNLATVGQASLMDSANERMHYILGNSIIPKDAAKPYDHFGNTFKTRTGRVVSMFRRAVTHVNTRGVIMLTYLASNGQWAAPVEVPIMSDPVLDARVAAGGVLPDGSIVIAVNYMNPTTSVFGDVKFFKSDDDAATWTLVQTITASQAGVYSYNIPFGSAALLGDAVVIPRYKRVGSNFSVGYYRSTDLGATWAEVDVYADATGTNDYNESAICSIGRLAFMVSRIGSGISGAFRLFVSTNAGSTWTDAGTSNFTGGDGAYVVAPSMHILRTVAGTPYIMLSYADRTGQALVYRTALVSDVLAGNYSFSERYRITGGLSNSSGYQSGFMEGNRYIGVVYIETAEQTAAQGTSFEVSIVNVPDYDSGWFAVVANRNYPLTLTATLQPKHLQVLFSPDTAAGTVYYVTPSFNTSSGSIYSSGCAIRASGNTVTLRTGSRVYGDTLFGSAGASDFASGHYRVVAWY